MPRRQNADATDLRIWSRDLHTSSLVTCRFSARPHNARRLRCKYLSVRIATLRSYTLWPAGTHDIRTHIACTHALRVVWRQDTFSRVWPPMCVALCSRVEQIVLLDLRVHEQQQRARVIGNAENRRIQPWLWRTDSGNLSRGQSRRGEGLKSEILQKR